MSENSDRMRKIYQDLKGMKHKAAAPKDRTQDILDRLTRLEQAIRDLQRLTSKTAPKKAMTDREKSKVKMDEYVKRILEREGC